MNYRIGIDFDNTIVCYDKLLMSAVTDFGWLEPPIPNSKTKIRDELRKTINGERKWQDLQAIIYGERMQEAILFIGFQAFLACRDSIGADFFVVSHKTQYAVRNNSGVNLQEASLRWMRNNKLLDAGDNSFKINDIFFEPTREEKIRRVIDLRCTHFIDDLPEIFEDQNFPLDVKKILFDPARSFKPTKGVKIFFTWSDILSYILGKKIA